MGENVDPELYVRSVHKSGQILEIQSINTPTLYEGRPAIIGSAIDITERKRAEANLRMQTQAINAASDMIVITDPNGNIQFANPAFERETGYTSDEVVVMHASTLAQNTDPAMTAKH